MAELNVSVQTADTADHPVDRETTREPERYVTPLVDIFETDQGLTVLADLPGVSNDEIEVNVDNNVLTLKATPQQETDREYLLREFQPTAYFRQFQLGRKIDQTRIEAGYRNGVLTLKLPLASEAKPRQVEVKVV